MEESDPIAQPITEAKPAVAGRTSHVQWPDDVTLVDVMGGCQRHEIAVHRHGFVALIDAMPRLVPEGHSADAAIVQAARVSYGQGTRKITEDRGLIRYLLRHRHTTPFEMVEFKFHCAMPIFVARQWIRHRTANVNEYSGRYSIVPDHFYRPTIDEVRAQGALNRQGGDEPVDPQTAQQFLDYLDRAESLYADYENLHEAGVTREQARIGLPVSIFTQWYWKCDLHNILRFLSLRLDHHAQSEIRDYAQAMWDLIEPIVPITLEAFRDYELDAIRLTRLEIDAIRNGCAEIDTSNSREQREWSAKRQSLGLDQ